jgi:hypothetical protein
MDHDDDYIMRLISARCGEETADAVVPISVLAQVLDIVSQMQDRLAEHSSRRRALSRHPRASTSLSRAGR